MSDLLPQNHRCIHSQCNLSIPSQKYSEIKKSHFLTAGAGSSIVPPPQPHSAHVFRYIRQQSSTIHSIGTMVSCNERATIFRYQSYHQESIPHTSQINQTCARLFLRTISQIILKISAITSITSHRIIRGK